MEVSNKSLSEKNVLKSSDGKIGKTISYYASFITLGLVVAVIGPTLPGLAEHTHTRLSEISFLFTAHSLGYLTGSLIGGWLYDRIPGHPVMAGALFIMTVVMSVVPVMSLLLFLIAILFLLGMADGVLDVGGNTLLVWVHGEKVTPFMNGLHFFFGLGAFLSPIIVAQAMKINDDINWAYWILAFIIFPFTVLLIRLQSPEVRALSGENKPKSINYILVALFAFFFFLFVGAELSIGGWIYSYAYAMGLAGKIKAAYITSAFWGSLMFGRLLAVPISFRVKPRWILLIDIVGCLIAGSIIALWSKTQLALWLGTIIMGLSVSSLFPTSISFMEQNMSITGKVTSWFLIGGSIGSMFFPWLIGQFFESVGPHVMIIILMLAFIAALCVLLAIFIYLRFYMEKLNTK